MKEKEGKVKISRINSNSTFNIKTNDINIIKTFNLVENEQGYISEEL
jgi:hypothetical protein